MQWAKRIFLFILVNILVLITISITLSLLGIGSYYTPYGLDYTSLLAFCAVAGFSGALISLLLSRFMAKMMMGVKVIDPRQANSEQKRMLDMIYRLAQKAGLSKMPEVGIYESPEINAFATGPSRNRALVAVSSGLLQRMDTDAVEGVIGHELSHVANGDMVTMTLIQGVVNTFVMFFARIAAWGITQAIAGNRDDRESNNSGLTYMINFMAIVVFEIIFSLLGSIVVARFSRWREFRADAGGARLAGKEKMIHALQALKGTTEMVDNSHPTVTSLKISGKSGGIMALFASHPDLDTRIAALRSLPVA